MRPPFVLHVNKRRSTSKSFGCAFTRPDRRTPYRSTRSARHQSAGYAWAARIEETIDGMNVSMRVSRIFGRLNARAGFPCRLRSRTPHSKKSTQTDLTFARVRATGRPRSDPSTHAAAPFQPTARNQRARGQRNTAPGGRGWPRSRAVSLRLRPTRSSSSGNSARRRGRVGSLDKSDPSRPRGSSWPPPPKSTSPRSRGTPETGDSMDGAGDVMDALREEPPITRTWPKPSEAIPEDARKAAPELPARAHGGARAHP